MKVENTEKFVARAQYDNWKGAIAVDDHAGDTDIRRWLEQAGQLDENDFVCGIEIHREYPGGEYRDPFISVLIFEAKNGRTFREAVEGGEGIPLKKLYLNMSLQDFLSKFKRLDIKLSAYGCLDDQTILVTETKEWK
ncbi:MAG: hypothetical protein OXL40_00875 [Bacteroidota bacterium]|nr:hypothetical protein [Bacteroidota bacterium]